MMSYQDLSRLQSRRSFLRKVPLSARWRPAMDCLAAGPWPRSDRPTKS